jgi:cell division protein FtsB
VAGRRRPRLTGRAGILVLVLAMLAISFAGSAKAYLRQRHDIDTLQSQIAERQTSIDSLQSQLSRWNDPAYVALQARERFGYVMPGETAYVALDANGNKIQPTSSLGAPVTPATPPPTAWWTKVWGSVTLAGDPSTGDPKK